MRRLKNFFSRFLLYGVSEKELDKYLHSGYLSIRQTRYVIGVINDAVKRSRGAGLKLSGKTVHQEKLAVLSVLELRHGFQGLEKEVCKGSSETIQECCSLFRTALDRILQTKVVYYTIDQPQEVKELYKAHLDELVETLLREILEGGVPKHWER